MTDVDMYIAEKNDYKDKKWILMELNKSARVFDESAIPYLTELSKAGEYMQRAALSLKITELEKTSQDIKERAVKREAEIMRDTGEKELINARKSREEAKTRGGSLRKTKKTKKRYNL